MLTLIAFDDFGTKVSRILQKSLAVEQISLKDALVRSWESCDTNMVATCAQRPHFGHFRELSKSLLLAGLPASFIYVRDSTLLVSSLSVPGRSPCYQCFEKRVASHITSPWSLPLEKFVQHTFDQNPNLTIPGMLPTTPLLAAARVRIQAKLQPSDFSQSFRINLVRSTCEQFKVHKVHGCSCLPVSLPNEKSRQIAFLKPLIENFHENGF